MEKSNKSMAYIIEFADSAPKIDLWVLFGRLIRQLLKGPSIYDIHVEGVRLMWTSTQKIIVH